MCDSTITKYDDVVIARVARNRVVFSARRARLVINVRWHVEWYSYSKKRKNQEKEERRRQKIILL